MVISTSRSVNMRELKISDKSTIRLESSIDFIDTAPPLTSVDILLKNYSNIMKSFNF